MKNIAVIDTETNWNDEVMSVGIIAADAMKLKKIDEVYFILDPEYKTGGMFENVLFIKPVSANLICSRKVMTDQICRWFRSMNIDSLFAYNAAFDKKHLPELCGYEWYDIMKTAAYRQYNPLLPPDADYCSTGRLKRNYGVESIMRMMVHGSMYFEKHNALIDARDELKIMQLIGKSADMYQKL